GLCFDAAEQVEAASRAAREAGVVIGGYVEIEVGMQRCGVATPQAARELAERISAAPGLTFVGLQAYHGSAQHLPTWEQRRAAIERAAGIVRETLECFDAGGLPRPAITGAGTGTFRIEGTS